MAKESEAVDCKDPYDLNRFISAQEGVYDRVLAELRGGLKRTHWIRSQPVWMAPFKWATKNV